MVQVLLGLQYMHGQCGIIHTDLKPENVMLTEALCDRVTSPTDAPPPPPTPPPQPAAPLVPCHRHPPPPPLSTHKWVETMFCPSTPDIWLIAWLACQGAIRYGLRLPKSLTAANVWCRLAD